jgi:hypothetical protein
MATICINIEASKPINDKDICHVLKQLVFTTFIAKKAKIRKFKKLPNQFNNSKFILN